MRADRYNETQAVARILEGQQRWIRGALKVKLGDVVVQPNRVNMVIDAETYKYLQKTRELNSARLRTIYAAFGICRANPLFRARVVWKDVTALAAHLLGAESSYLEVCRWFHAAQCHQAPAIQAWQLQFLRAERKLRGAKRGGAMLDVAAEET